MDKSLYPPRVRSSDLLASVLPNTPEHDIRAQNILQSLCKFCAFMSQPVLKDQGHSSLPFHFSPLKASRATSVPVV